MITSDPKTQISRLAGLFLAVFVAVLVVAAAQGQAQEAPAAKRLAYSASATAADTQGPAKQIPTFTKDVVPILQRSCQSCHRPESIAPMSLLTYEQVRPWATAIKKRVAAREMPPWFIDRNVGITKFKDDPSLSDEEIATIVKWADGGSPMGDPADMPPPVKFPDPTAWQLGTPDLIVESKPITVPAAAPDSWGDLESEAPAVTEDRWIKAVEVKPVMGYNVVHHSGAFQVFDEGLQGGTALGRTRVTMPALGDTLLTMYVVGKNGDTSPEGTGRLLKAGSRIRFNYHLHSVGVETVAKLAVGFHFYPKGYVPKYQLQTDVWGGDYEREFELPAGAANVRSDAYAMLTKPAVITQFEPHMHNRGKAMCLELIYPPETLPGETNPLRRHPKSTYSKHAIDTEMISCVDRFNFGWLRAYIYADEVAPVVPAGTILHFIMWHDNSTANKLNWDSTNWVGWGQRSIDEMNHAWMGYYYISEEDYQQRIAARRGKAADFAKAENANKVTGKPVD
ncbi:MAG: hypothetical protein HYX74_00185 [Acidobacteria bacterium]|nr:hypothetical protein [Acidobacteriota bacterium]